MLGAIAGDVIGSVYEARPVKRTDFQLFPQGACFTDDTVLTVAIAAALLGDGDYAAVSHLRKNHRSNETTRLISMRVVRGK